MKHKYCAESEGILIRPLKIDDIEFLRKWRNNPNLSKYLRSIPHISKESQMKWYEKYNDDDKSLFFAILNKEKNSPIGSVALYNLRDNKCDVGKIVIGDSSAHGKGIGYRALLLAIAVAIKELGIKTIRLDVHENNLPAKRIYEKAGFSVVGKHPFEKGGHELEMEIKAEVFYDVNLSAKDIKIFMEDAMSEFLNQGGILSL